MPKLLPNRVSKVISTETQDALRTAVRNFDQALGDPIAITDEEVKKLLKVASTRKRIMDDIYLIMQQHSGIVRAPLALEEIGKDKTMFEFLTEADTFLAGLLFKVRRGLAVCGAEYSNAGGVFEADVKSEVDRNIAEARIAKAKLDAIDRKKGGGGSATPATPPK